MSGYKGMLRDRCPKVVNYALKWQKAKEKWIDHVYSRFIKIIGDEFDETHIIRKSPENKKSVTLMILGIIKGKPKNFKFDSTIDWDNLTDEEREYWHRISSWVYWFSTNHLYIEDLYKNGIKVGKNESDLKVEIIQSYLMNLMPKENCSDEEKEAKYKYIDNLVDFLIGTFNGKY